MAIYKQKFLLQRCALRTFPDRTLIRLRVIEGPNALDQIAFYAFQSFLVEVQTDAGQISAA